METVGDCKKNSDKLYMIYKEVHWLNDGYVNLLMMSCKATFKEGTGSIFWPLPRQQRWQSMMNTVDCMFWNVFLKFPPDRGVSR